MILKYLKKVDVVFYHAKKAQRHSRGTALSILNHLNPELISICYLLALLGAHHFLRFSRIKVNELFRLSELGC